MSPRYIVSLRAALLGLALLLGVSPLRCQHRLLDVPGPNLQERLGRSLATVHDVDLDGFSDFAVGGGGNRVFVLSGATGAVVRTIMGAGSGDDFGWSLATVGDLDFDGLDDLAVGAPQIAAGGAGYCAIVSAASGATLLTIAGQLSGDRFGFSVARGGDADGDGVPDVVVGAPGAGSPPQSGFAGIYSGAAGTLIHGLTGALANDALGTAVAGGFDRDGDGVADFAVGAPFGNQPPGGFFGGTGQVVVVSGGTGLVLQVILGDDPDDAFGSAVAAIGDADFDGAIDLVIGVPGDDDGGLDAGGARVVSGATGATLTSIAGLAPGARAGAAVGGVGDVDGDGLLDLLLGAPADSTVAISAGSVLVVDALTGGVRLMVRGTGPFDRLGEAVSGAGDLDGDGRGELLVGVPGASGPVLARGAVRLFSRDPWLGPAGAGDVGLGLGGPFDVLFLNGDAGGASRRVALGLGQPLSLDVAQPPTRLQPANFALFGVRALPLLSDVIALPGGLGSMAFVPCPLLPTAAPLLFTVASTFGAGPCPAVAAATPTPWTATRPAGFPVPLLFTIQGVIEDAGGALRVTNGVVLDVR